MKNFNPETFDTTSLVACSLCLLLLIAIGIDAQAQNYSIDWYTIDGGGGTSTSNDGRFSVSGTAGQPDAGQSASNDGRFQLNGGFWYGEMIFCGCTLSIAYSSGNVTISWPGELGGCILEGTDELRGPPFTTVWTPVSPQPSGHSYTVAVTGKERLFRLRSPQPAEPGFVEVSGNMLAHLADDTDMDGIPDERERQLGLDPTRADTDGDGFSDLFEDTFRAFGFDPLRSDLDSDHDGLTDAFELLLGTNPFDPDSDHDGWLDLDEVLNARLGFDPKVFDPDADYDGVSDRLEATLGTSVQNPDTDGDGLTDAEELLADTNPLVADDPAALGELVGRTVSDAMLQAWQAMRQGASFPTNLARELPCPEILAPFFDGSRQQGPQPNGPTPGPPPWRPIPTPGGMGPPDLNAAYPSYNAIVRQLQLLTQDYDGSHGPRILRLFRYPVATDGGRYIYVLKITKNPDFPDPSKPALLFMAEHHARELITPAIAMGLIKELTLKYAAGDATARRYVDNAEIWVVPLVNPDGYTMAVGEYPLASPDGPRGYRVNWRKNTRLVTEGLPPGFVQTVPGVDPNRNYGFEHISEFSLDYRRHMRSPGSNGVDPVTGELASNNNQYPASAAFTEVETRAIRALASGRFVAGATLSGFSGSLSWHSHFGGVGHPMIHPTADGLAVGDEARLDALTAAVAAATGYVDWRDTIPTALYDVYGDSEEWLYKAKGVMAIVVETYSPAERGGTGPSFFPTTALVQNAVVANNVQGALAFLGALLP